MVAMRFFFATLLLAVCAAAQTQAPSPDKQPMSTKAAPSATINPELAPATQAQSSAEKNNAEKNNAEQNKTSQNRVEPDKAEPAGTGPDLPSADPNADDRNFSSSRETILDVSPPKDDRKDHPDSASAVDEAMPEPDTDVQEFQQWNPMKALKDVEVGDYYFKRKNYRAALERYKEALVYKQDDAVATFRLAQCQEQMGDKTSAMDNYAAYLKILPHGPFADEAKDSLASLKGHL